MSIPHTQQLPDPDKRTKTAPVASFENGYPFIVEGKRHIVYGLSGTGKGWLVTTAVRQALKKRKTVVFMDWESDIFEQAERLATVGCPKRVFTDPSRVGYIDGAEVNSEIAEEISTYANLVIIDAVNSAGGYSNDAGEFMRWFDRVVTPLHKNGCATLLIDHQNKASNPLQLLNGPGGTQQKTAAVDLMYQLLPSSFAVGRRGRATILLQKDRGGVFRSVSRNEQLGYLDFDGEKSWKLIYDPVAQGEPTEEITKRIIDALPLKNKTEAKSVVQGANALIGTVFDRLVAEGAIVKHQGMYHLADIPETD